MNSTVESEPLMVIGSAAIAPEIGAAAILLLGFVAGIVARILLSRSGTTLTNRSEGYVKIVGTAFQRLAPLAFWSILIIAVFWSFNLLSLGERWDYLESVITFVPKLVVGLVIIGLGHVVGITLRDIVRRSISDTEFSASASNVAYTTMVILGAIIGVQHIGVNVSYFATLVLVVLTVLLSSLGLAFALGARQHIANLIARSEINQYNAGEKVRIGEIEGAVIEIKNTALVLSTEEGHVTIPASRFSRSASVRLLDDL